MHSFKSKARKLDTKYIRYVDDIRIFSKDKITGQKSIAYLDLLARDLGLIPQASKILVHEVTDLDQLIKHQKSKFSEISRQHKAKQGLLKSKTHKKLKKRFIDCFDERSSEDYLDKTIISFSLYRLNSDLDVKDIILKHYTKIYTHFSGVLFYLRKHFPEDEKVRCWLISLLLDENLLFQHISALILKYFPDLPFIEELYEKIMEGDCRNWLLRYFMIEWLYENKKYDLIRSYPHGSNYFIARELNKFKEYLITDDSTLNLFSKGLMESSDSLIALQGLYFLFGDLSNLTDEKINRYNSYIKYQYSNKITNYIQFSLKREFNIENPENFFREEIWSDVSEYDELNKLFRLFNNFKNTSPSYAVITLNSFNNLVFDKLCQVMGVDKKDNDYGVNLNAGYIEASFPVVNKCFMEINDKRNQNTEAHPYNKHGHIRDSIKFWELEKLIHRERRSLQEICLKDMLRFQVK